jgi:hypothetical protein
MRVRLDTSLVWFGREYHHGDEIDLPDDVAKRYIATHQAEPVVTAAPPAVEAMMRDNTTQQTTMRKLNPQFRRR